MKQNILTIRIPNAWLSDPGELCLRLVPAQGDAACGIRSDEQEVPPGHDARWTVGDLRRSLEQMAEAKERLGRRRTAETYRLTLHCMNRLGDEADTPMDRAWVERLAVRLQADGLSLNTVGFYMKRMRSACNQAASKGIAVPRGLFDTVYTGNAKTAKRAVDAGVIRQLETMRPLKPIQALALDLFLFSLYTRGMSFVDMAYLKPSNIQGGVLTYQRRKTGQRLSMAWLPEMQSIVDRHHTEGQPYLLPIIKGGVADEERARSTMQFRVNTALKALGRKIGLTRPLTMYVARHSWASIAQASHVPLSVISTALGHTSERTTRIYLNDIDSSRVDEANERVLKEVLSFPLQQSNDKAEGQEMLARRLVSEHDALGGLTAEDSDPTSCGSCQDAARGLAAEGSIPTKRGFGKHH